LNEDANTTFILLILTPQTYIRRFKIKITYHKDREYVKNKIL
jgi:hypothetical protein